jgi:hypothetical protein
MTFTTDTVIETTVTMIFTTDTIIETTVIMTFTTDTVNDTTVTMTFTTDTIIETTVKATFTTDTINDTTDTAVQFHVNGTGQQQITGHNETPRPVAGLQGEIYTIYICRQFSGTVRRGEKPRGGPAVIRGTGANGGNRDWVTGF